MEPEKEEIPQLILEKIIAMGLVCVWLLVHSVVS